MKIGYFTDTYLPNRDGVVTHICGVRELLEKKGHDVFVFTSGSRQDNEENRDRKVFYYRSAKFAPYPQYKVALFPFFAPKKAREAGIEVVHSHAVATMGLASVQAAKELKIGSVATFHTLIPKAARYLSGVQFLDRIGEQALWKYLEWYYGLFGRVIAPTNFAKKILSEHGIQSTVIINGVDAGRFSPDLKAGEKAKKRLGIPKEKKVALYLGRVAEEKNIGGFLDAAAEAKKENGNLAFVIAGKGPALLRYKKMAQKMGLGHDVLFPGFVPESDLPAFYNCADVFVLPSLFETQGLSALEAMSCGVPVCVQRESATAELVAEKKNGFLFSDAQECAENIGKAIRDRKGLSANARKTGLKYTREKTANELLKIYNSLL